MKRGKMDKINTFRKHTIILFVSIFIFSNILMNVIVVILNQLEIISVNTNDTIKILMTYGIIVSLFSVVILIIFSSIWFSKYILKIENNWLLKYINSIEQVDIFTNFSTKKALEEKVTSIIKRHPNAVGCMLYLDIDNIKFINDKYGYEIGDEFILKFAEILKYFNKYNSVISHINGGEFIVYLHCFKDEQELLELCKELYSYADEFKVTTPDGVENKVHFSIGLSWYPENAQNFDTLYKYSDFALYYAKKNEKGRLTEFNLEDYKRNFNILENKLAINQLLDNKLVQFAYQPIVCLKTGDIYGYEALIRSKMNSFKSPFQIIEVATTQSKLPQLEALVIFSVYEDLKNNDEKLGDRKIFVNSLPSQVLDEDNVYELIKLYKNYIDRVVVEITEQDVINPGNLERKLAFVNEYNLELAIDDFGSGFSNEKRILALKPSIVKVDMELIQGISLNVDKQTIVSNLLDFCHNKNIRVIAEGVETSEDLKYISKLGVDYVQGYYVAKPNFEFLEIPDEIKQEIIDISILSEHE